MAVLLISEHHHFFPYDQPVASQWLKGDSFSIVVMHPRILAFVLLIPSCALLAQTLPNAPAAGSKECGIKAIQICALHVAQDEVGIITAPLRMKQSDLPTLLIFSAGTGAALATDVDAMDAVGMNPSREHNASKYSDYAGLYAPAAAVTVGFFVGSAKHNHRLQETSILAEEAMVDSFFLNHRAWLRT